MFQTYLPQKLILVALVVTALAACSAQPTTEESVKPSPCPDTEAYTELQDWLQMEEQTSNMETSQVVAELVKLGRPDEARDLFYFGLLNQQLGTASNWRQARDSFREIRKNTTLSPEQRRIASMLERYNIYRLDNRKDRRDLLKKQGELEKDLESTAQEAEQLEEKIQAITELEADMSTRIEQEQ